MEFIVEVPNNYDEDHEEVMDQITDALSDAGIPAYIYERKEENDGSNQG